MEPLDQFAPYYDLEYADYDADLDMYRQLAEWCAPTGSDTARVLEMACGSGRVLLALAAAGHECVGVDASVAMLELARRRAAERGLTVELRQGRMEDSRSVTLPGANLVICALNSFAYLTTRQAQTAALRNMHDALAHGGLAVLDLTPPGNTEPFPAQGEVVLQGQWPYEGGHVVKLVSGEWNPATQLHHVRWIYDNAAADGLLRRTMIEQTLRYIYPAEAELLVEAAGMRVEALYGSYELDPFDAGSERMIVLARRFD